MEGMLRVDRAGWRKQRQEGVCEDAAAADDNVEVVCDL